MVRFFVEAISRYLADILHRFSLPKRLSEPKEFSQRPGDKIGTLLATFQSVLDLTSLLRPIPQWFRLKTDTKIQVRPAFLIHEYQLDSILTVQRKTASLEKDQAEHLSTTCRESWLGTFTR
jgi:hypothetical protein